MAQVREARVGETVTQGAVLGMAGGLVEIVWIGSFGLVAGSDTAEVARVITATVGWALPSISLVAAPVFYGIVIHMLAAAGLGVALMFLWRWLAARPSRGVNEFSFMAAALAMIWAFNFFVVLPSISSAFVDLQRVFVDLVPYPASLASKLLFGVAGAIMLRYAGKNKSALLPIRVGRR
jgi:hypothetical protein